MRIKLIALIGATAVLSAGNALADGVTLGVGETLKPGHAILSDNEAYQLIMQEDGNLVLSDRSGLQVLWNSGTQGEGLQTVLQTNGALVVFDRDNKEVWRSDAVQYPVLSLSVSDAGEFDYFTPLHHDDHLFSLVDGQKGALLLPVAPSADMMDEGAMATSLSPVCSTSQIPGGYIVDRIIRNSQCKDYGGYEYVTKQAVDGALMCAVTGVPSGFVANEILNGQSCLNMASRYRIKRLLDGVMMCNVHSVPSGYVVNSISTTAGCNGEAYRLRPVMDGIVMCNVHPVPAGYRIESSFSSAGCKGHTAYRLRRQ